MKIKVTLHAEVTEDLTFHGYDEDRTWDSLTDDEQNEVLDSIREQTIVDVSIKPINE